MKRKEKKKEHENGRESNREAHTAGTRQTFFTSTSRWLESTTPLIRSIGQLSSTAAVKTSESKEKRGRFGDGGRDSERRSQRGKEADRERERDAAVKNGEKRESALTDVEDLLPGAPVEQAVREEAGVAVDNLYETRAVCVAHERPAMQH